MLTLFLFSATSTVAQYKSIIAESDSAMGNNGRTIIRGGHYRDAWCYQNNSNNNNLIHLEQLYYSHAYAKIPSNIIIHDMQPFISKMYFCGEDTVLHKGVAGFITTHTISISLFDSVHICCYYIDSTTVLKRFVLLEKTLYDQTMVAIGENSRVGVGHNNDALNLLVECRFTHPHTTISYDLKPAYHSTDGYERLDDICLSDRYLVTVGYCDDPSYEGITLHLWDTANSPYCHLLDEMYYYPEQLSNNDSKLYLSEIADNHVAVSYAKYDIYENYHKLVLRTFEMSTMDNHVSQQVKIDKFMLHGMTHIPYDNGVVVLCDYENHIMHMNTSNYVYFDPMNESPYGSVILYDPSKYYNSITSYNRQYFISSGDLHWMERDKIAPLPAYNLLDPTPEYCPNYEEINVEIIENLKRNHEKNELEMLTKEEPLDIRKIPVDVLLIKMNCYSD